MDCTVENRKLVTLTSAVKAAIVDKYEDFSKVEQRYSHWAARELKLLYTQILPKLKNKVLLTVNANTKTAALPKGFSEETFVGGIDSKWQKIPFRLNNKLVDSKNITDIPCEDKCPKCQQDTGICNDLVITEDTVIVLVNGLPYNKVTTKKLYPNGDYYLEISTPILNINNNTVDYVIKKEFISNFDLKPCGCLDTTPANIVTLQTYCPDIYCTYYSKCNYNCDENYGGYKIFEESGLIQFDANFSLTKVYIEYNGFIQKINGQYYIPDIAFECIVEGIKRRAIKDKSNVTRWQIIDQNEYYKNAKRDLQKVLGKISLSLIVQAIDMLPKFDFDYGYNWYAPFTSCGTYTVPATTSNVDACSGVSGGSTCGSATVNNNNITIINHAVYSLAVKADGSAGTPVVGLTTYQNNILIGAIFDYIIVNNAVETQLKGDYTFNSVTGTLTRGSNIWQTDDVLIINYNKT